LHEDKIYLVTHNELSPGYQVAQTAHAIADFLITQPALAQTWHTISNSLIVLSVPKADDLYALHQQALSLGMNVTAFREPDILDEITGLAFAPSTANKQFLAALPLVGNRHNTTKSRENKLKSVAFKVMDEQGFVSGEHALQTGRSLRELFNSQNHAAPLSSTAMQTIEQFLTLLYYGITKNDSIFKKVSSIHENELLYHLWMSEDSSTWQNLLYEALTTIALVKQEEISPNGEVELFTVICKRMLELL
jgi:hypothetical protein